MRCYDGAEVYELVGSLTLNKVTSIINKSDVALYLDDGLGIVQNVSKLEIERKKKAIVKVKVFKECGLSITLQCNLKTVVFLDVALDLDNNISHNNNKSIYINTYCHHPSILKQLPKLIEK